MTGTVINLNKARKSRARDEKRKSADENAVKFGRSKTERNQIEAELKMTAKRLDDHRRDT